MTDNTNTNTGPATIPNTHYIASEMRELDAMRLYQPQVDARALKARMLRIQDEFPMTRLVAFTGPKESGKDTAFKIVQEDMIKSAEDGQGIGTIVRQPFAQPVKEACRVIFGLTFHELEDAKAKETVLDRWPYVTPRKLMQDVANYFRLAYGPDVWVMRWLENVIELCKQGVPYVAVTDLRFPNELHRIQQLKGKVFYIVRPEAEEKLRQQVAEGNTLATNASEAHWDVIRKHADCTTINDSTLSEFADRLLYQFHAIA